MSLKFLKQKADRQKIDDTLPAWVSNKNITLKAFECIQQLKIKKLQYITSHNKTSHFQTKKLFQISASEVARKVKCATPTLISTSAYSAELKSYLAEINQELEQKKNRKIQTHKKTLSSGMKQRKKGEISSALQETRKELSELKKKNAEEQVLFVLKSLSLPVKHKLGID